MKIVLSPIGTAAVSFLICLSIVLLGCRGKNEVNQKDKDDNKPTENLDWERWSKLGEDVPALPVFDLKTLKEKLVSGTPTEKLRAIRDRRLRQRVLSSEGGSEATEKAVLLGLDWLVKHQSKDGNWSINEFHRGVAGCTCGSPGKLESDSAGTALVLMALLGNGQTHLKGKHHLPFRNGLRWLLVHQKEDGDLRAGFHEKGMYSHGQAAHVLCETFAMTGDESLREPAQKSVDFICQAQHSLGGWKYKPESVGDTSVTGWQLGALHAAVNAGLDVDQKVLDAATRYLDSVEHHNGAAYAYEPGREPTHVMTGEALLCRIYLEKKEREEPVRRGVKSMLETHPPEDGKFNLYYFYHATQTIRHAGGDDWRKWNGQLSQRILAEQETVGHRAGSWKPSSVSTEAAGGRLYVTALTVMTLEVYYRSNPLLRDIELN